MTKLSNYYVSYSFQPDCLDDLAYAIMYELTKLAYRVSEADVSRARNQVTMNHLSFICFYVSAVKYGTLIMPFPCPADFGECWI